MKQEEQPAPDAPPMILASGGFADWLAARNVSLAFTTYQAGRLFFIGRKSGGLRAHERRINHCQGLWTDGDSLWTSARTMIWRFQNDLREGERTETGADRRFAPREARVTGAIDIHDIGFGDVGGEAPAPIFVNTAFNCLATISQRSSFRALWRPKFISALIGEDRCHLNGLAMDGARPAYVSAVARSDVADGWRDSRDAGGIVIDVGSGEIVAHGLSMPHSPRLHEGRLWILNSGRGELGWIDPVDGRFTPVAFCPGYARGLAFIDRFAVIGLSRPRRNQTFEGLQLEQRLADKGSAKRCGLIIVDTQSGATVEWLRLEHTIDELYDVAVLKQVVQAEAIGFGGPEIEAAVRAEPARPDVMANEPL